MNEIYQKRIQKLKESLSLLGQASSAEDHYAYDWAEEARKTATQDIKSVLIEFLNEGEGVFSTFFPNLYEKLQQHNLDLSKVDLTYETDIDYLVQHKNPPPSWETLPSNEQLISAIKKKKFNLVSKAVENGADINLKHDGQTPLMIALFWKNYNSEIIDFLIEKGADLSIKADDGKTLLIIAASQGNSNVVKLALTTGVDPNLNSPYGGTALMKAAYYGYTEIMSLLLQSGADPNAIGDDVCGIKSSPLHQAAEIGELEAVKLLLKAGANPNFIDGQGRTPLETAKHWQRDDVEKELTSASI